MTTVLLLNNNKREDEFLKATWEEKLNIQVTECESEVLVLRNLLNDSSITTLVIGKNASFNKNFFEELNKIETKLLIIHEGTLQDQTHHESKPVKDLFQFSEVSQYFHEMQKQKNEDIKKLYTKIRLYHFLQFNEAKTDIYLNINSEKYIKIVSKGDFYTKEIIEKYQKREIEYLYILKSDISDFFSEILSNINDFNISEDTSDNLKREVFVALVDVVYEDFKSLGQTNLVISKTKETIVNVLQSIEKVGNLWDFFKNSNSSRDYLSEHSFSIAILISAISEHLEWRSENTTSQLVMAAFLHDIALKNKNLSYISTDDFERINSLDVEDQNDLLGHSSLGERILGHIHELPDVVRTIIKEHHELPDGKGFPKKLDSFTISPMSCVFIVAEDFYHLLKNGSFSETSKKSAVEIISQKYTEGNFKAPVKALISVFMKGIS